MSLAIPLNMLQATVCVSRVWRIHTYWRILSIRWVARMARYLYEVPRGQDERLVQRASDWFIDARNKFDHYAQLAQSLLEQP